MLTLDHNHLQGSLGPALVATLSTDSQLRQTLLQGACFFTLAAGKAKHSKGSDTHPDRAEQHRRRLKGQEEQAEGILALIEGSVRKVIEQVMHTHRDIVMCNALSDCVSTRITLMNLKAGTVSLYGLLAWLVYLTWNGIISRFAHPISHQEPCCCVLPQWISSQVFHHRCIVPVHKLVCLSVQQDARQAMSTCFTTLQAAERGGGSEENSNSVTLPDCRGLGTDPAVGQLPELLPAVLMTHQAFQQLQLQLLPFQVRRQQEGPKYVLHVGYQNVSSDVVNQSQKA